MALAGFRNTNDDDGDEPAGGPRNVPLRPRDLGQLERPRTAAPVFRFVLDHAGSQIDATRVELSSIELRLLGSLPED